MKQNRQFMQATIFCVFILQLFFYSCKKDSHEYSVAPEFDEYVQRFRDEANKCGLTFDFQKSGLIIEFTNDLGKFDGMCHYEKPIRIQIDKTAWDKYGKYSNGDLLREKLIFHELGHGFLGRKHKNDLFQTGDWVSMMHGGNGELPSDGRKSWNINYRRMRRDYYIDELFNPTTAFPLWATENHTFKADSIMTAVFTESFIDNGNHWSIGIGDSSISSINNGLYSFQNISKHQSYYVAKTISVDKTKNFSFEIDLKLISVSDDKDCGIVWGGNSGSNLYYFKMTNDKRFKVGNYSNFGWYIEVPNNAIKPSDYNKLVVCHFDSIFYLFINDVYVYQTDYDGFFGDIFGFQLQPQTTVLVDKMQISYITSGAFKVDILPVEISKETFKGTLPDINSQLTN